MQENVCEASESEGESCEFTCSICRRLNSFCIMLACIKLFMTSVWQVVWQRAEVNSSQWLDDVNMEITWPQRKLFPRSVSLQDWRKQLLYNVCRKSLKFGVCLIRQLTWTLEILVGMILNKKCCSTEIICEKRENVLLKQIQRSQGYESCLACQHLI